MAQRGQGRAAFHQDRQLLGQLLLAQTGDLAAPSATGAKGDHQDGPVPDVAQAARKADHPLRRYGSARVLAFANLHNRHHPAGHDPLAAQSVGDSLGKQR